MENWSEFLEFSYIPQETIPLDDSEVKDKNTVKDLDLRRFRISQKTLNQLLMILIKRKENKSRNGKIKKKTKDETFKLRLLNIDTDVELDLESLTNFLKRKQKKYYKIKGINIVKTKTMPQVAEPAIEGRQPMLFHSKFKIDSFVHETKVTEDIPHQDVSKGVLKYKLSDRTFIDKGWTALPVEKIVRKLNVYRMRPAHPEFDWFAHNNSKGRMTYDSGETLATFDDKGRGRWYYKNGKLALEYYDSKEENIQQRIIVYSSGKPDERGRSRPVTLLAMFDFLGNGVVFDHSGRIRLKYNQSEGVVLDRALGPACHWKWHSLNDPPILQRVMMENYIKPIDPDILQFDDDVVKHRIGDCTEMLSIEFNNYIKEQEIKMAQKYQPFQIKMKALKINDQFSLRVIDQANVHLTFKSGSANLKLNLGMVIDSKEIISTETQDVYNFTNSLEKIRGQTDSVMELQEKLEKVRTLDRIRTIQEQKFKLKPMPRASVDCLKDATSRPISTLRTVKSLSDNKVPIECNCKRNPPYSGVYYDTRY